MVTYTPMQLSPQARRALLQTACDVIRRRLGVGDPLDVPDRAAGCDDPAISQHAGCFVSLHRRDTHMLRGCIGVLESDRPLIEALIGAAESTLRDPRFVDQPVTLQELPQLDMEVTVIGPMRQAASPLAFDPLQDGIFLTAFGRSGCFLPQVGRETGWSREQLLTRLCTEKLGLHPNAWQHPSAVLRLFSADVIGPEPFPAAAT